MHRPVLGVVGDPDGGVRAAARIGRLETVSEIRAGNVRNMKPRKPREDNQAEAAPTFTPVENVELPF
jgi:hypothetical protein